jgi:hypothetical protein
VRGGPCRLMGMGVRCYPQRHSATLAPPLPQLPPLPRPRCLRRQPAMGPPSLSLQVQSRHRSAHCRPSDAPHSLPEALLATHYLAPRATRILRRARRSGCVPSLPQVSPAVSSSSLAVSQSTALTATARAVVASGPPRHARPPASSAGAPPRQFPLHRLTGRWVMEAGAAHQPRRRWHQPSLCLWASPSHPAKPPPREQRARRCRGGQRRRLDRRKGADLPLECTGQMAGRRHPPPPRALRWRCVR